MNKMGNKIRELRQKADISQQKLAELLGVLRTTVSQIENGDRELTINELVKLSDIFDVSVEQLLNIKKEPEVILMPDKKENIKETGIRINVPQKNVKKFKEVLLYILNKVGSKPNIGETVIYKLLYFIDFNYYEKYEEQLIGATYIKNKFGPTPVEFCKVVESMIKAKEIIKIKSSHFQYPQTKYLPTKEADISCLSANEKDMIDNVLNCLSDKSAKEISDYSHKDVPWLTTEEGKRIEYESVFYRTEPYTMRRYDESI